MSWKKIVKTIFPTVRGFINFYLMTILLLFLYLSVKSLSKGELFVLSFFIIYTYNEWSKEMDREIEKRC